MTGTPRAARSLGMSRRKSWSCRVLVAVLSKVRAPRQQRRHQIGVGLADAGARLDDERRAAVDGAGDRRAPSRSAPARSTCSGSAGRERAAAATGAVATGLLRAALTQAAAVRARLRCARSGRADSRRRFFSRRSDSSSPTGSATATSMRLSRSACSMRSSISRRGREWMVVVHGRPLGTRLVRGFGAFDAGQSDYSFLSWAPRAWATGFPRRRGSTAATARTSKTRCRSFRTPASPAA